jgi:hypothetical protein
MEEAAMKTQTCWKRASEATPLPSRPTMIDVPTTMPSWALADSDAAEGQGDVFCDASRAERDR